MKATLISIGNSRGIRIPKLLIEECQLDNGIEINVRDKTILIHAPRKLRSGWDQAFQKMGKNRDDILLDSAVSTSKWDHEEWQWK